MITASHFSKSYRKHEIIATSNFEIRGNKITFLMGPNGSGKTTLIKCLMGMEMYNGTLLFDEKPIGQVHEECLVLWDDCPFYQTLSGLSNLMIFGEGKRKKPEILERAQKYLDMDTLKKKVSLYSYGQKKKLSLVLVDLLSPTYLFMDEISNGLDYETIRFLKDQVKDWSERMTIFLTGHQFDFYNDVIDDLLIFKENQIILSKLEFDRTSDNLGDIYAKEIN